MRQSVVGRHSETVEGRVEPPIPRHSSRHLKSNPSVSVLDPFQDGTASPAVACMTEDFECHFRASLLTRFPKICCVVVRKCKSPESSCGVTRTSWSRHTSNIWRGCSASAAGHRAEGSGVTSDRRCFRGLKGCV